MNENQVVNIICAEIREILGQDMVSELVRYRTAFPKEPDYNFGQHGHLLVSNYQVREFYSKCRYFPRFYPLGDNGMWKHYLTLVGAAIRKQTDNTPQWQKVLKTQKNHN